eukprot:scaffold1287_cov253-Ochromonas_danica.AAC.17
MMIEKVVARITSYRRKVTFLLERSKRAQQLLAKAEAKQRQQQQRLGQKGRKGSHAGVGAVGLGGNTSTGVGNKAITSSSQGGSAPAMITTATATTNKASSMMGQQQQQQQQMIGFEEESEKLMKILNLNFKLVYVKFI